MVLTFGRTSTSYASMRLRPSTKTAIRAMAGRASSAFTLRSRWRTLLHTRSGPLLRTLRFSQPHSCLHTPSPCPQREYELSLLAIEPRLEGLPYWNWFIDKHACVLLSPRL